MTATVHMDCRSCARGWTVDPISFVRSLVLSSACLQDNCTIYLVSGRTRHRRLDVRDASDFLKHVDRLSCFCDCVRCSMHLGSYSSHCRKHQFFGVGAQGTGNYHEND